MKMHDNWFLTNYAELSVATKIGLKNVSAGYRLLTKTLAGSQKSYAEQDLAQLTAFAKDENGRRETPSAMGHGLAYAKKLPSA